MACNRKNAEQRQGCPKNNKKFFRQRPARCKYAITESGKAVPVAA